MLGVLGIHRRKELGPFGDRERALGEFLVPYLSKVLHRFAFLEEMDLFVQTEMGVLILMEPDARLLYANDAALGILGPQFPGTLSLLGKGKHPVFFQGSQGFHRVRSFPLHTAFPGSLPLGIDALSDFNSGNSIRVVLLEPPSKPFSRNRRMADQGLSPRQQEISYLVMRGCSNREISEKLSITEQTVKDHLHDIYEKLGVKNRCALIARFSEFP
ncbi:MAG: helix-turn-helix domain-containing protein [Sulfobacillus sp.]